MISRQTLVCREHFVNASMCRIFKRFENQMIYIQVCKPDILNMLFFCIIINFQFGVNKTFRFFTYTVQFTT